MKMKLTDISNNKAKEIIKGAPKEATHFSCIEGETQYYKNETATPSIDDVFINVFRDIFQPYILSLSDLENKMNIDTIATQSPEEKEALDQIDNTAAQVESLSFNDWLNGEHIESNETDWNNGDECEYFYDTKHLYIYVGEHPHGDGHYVFSEEKGITYVANGFLRKPECPQQKLERERLEAAYDLYCTWRGKDCQSFDAFIICNVDNWLAIVDKTNYRKGE